MLPARAAGCTSRDGHVQLAAPACLSLGKLLYANGKVKKHQFLQGRQRGVHGVGLVGLFPEEQCCARSNRGLLLPFSCLRHCPTCFLTTNSAEPFFSPVTALYKQQNPGSPAPWTALPVQEVNSKAPNSNYPAAHLLPGLGSYLCRCLTVLPPLSLSFPAPSAVSIMHQVSRTVDSITLSWSQPDQPNGVILDYELQYYEKVLGDLGRGHPQLLGRGGGAELHLRAGQ